MRNRAGHADRIRAGPRRQHTLPVLVQIVLFGSGWKAPDGGRRRAMVAAGMSGPEGRRMDPLTAHRRAENSFSWPDVVNAGESR